MFPLGLVYCSSNATNGSNTRSRKNTSSDIFYQALSNQAFVCFEMFQTEQVLKDLEAFRKVSEELKTWSDFFVSRCDISLVTRQAYSLALSGIPSGHTRQAYSLTVWHLIGHTSSVQSHTVCHPIGHTSSVQSHTIWHPIGRSDH
jgi:hypothetical protein